MRVVFLAFALLLAAPGAHAQQRMAADDLARKNEQGYVTGLPLFAYTTDIGFGIGARVYYYWNGTRTDPLFAITPYLHRVFLQAFVSTRGIQYHWLDYDAPRIGGSPYRIRAQVIFGRNINSNYFGHGNSALAPLQFPGAAGTFDKFSDYQRAQQEATLGTTYAKYDVFDLAKPFATASVERLFFGNRVRLLGGLGFGYTWIDDYTGKQVDARDAAGNPTTATQAPTRLREDCDAGLLVGCNGGYEGALRLAVSYDTRDFEPDPNRGVFAELAADVVTVALGSEYDYVRVLGAVRGYWSPIARHDIVFAGRAFLQVQTRGTPFYVLNALPFTEDFRLGLGGHRTLRGYRQDRFVGRTMAAVTGEVRWTFYRFTLKRQKLALIGVPFVDAGRSFDHSGKLTVRDWRPSYGGALRISWNLATLITIDYGRSSEDTGIYINFGHTF